MKCRTYPPIVDKQYLSDIQNDEKETRNISLDKVGITNVKFPVRIKNKDQGVVDVSATVSMFAGLSRLAKGHNLSRFMEVLLSTDNDDSFSLSKDSLYDILSMMESKLGSDDVYARFEFDYYVKKESPASKRLAPMMYACAFTGIKKHGKYDFILEVNVVAASVCPCSREMSLLKNLSNGEIQLQEGIQEVFNGVSKTEIGNSVGMGAHNQRSKIRAEVIFKNNEMVWIEDLVVWVENQASAPTYPLLKREDEKYVTELGYMNAKFSEDIARDVQIMLESQPEIAEWSLKVRNEESIHPFDVSSYQSSKGWRYHH